MPQTKAEAYLNTDKELWRQPTEVIGLEGETNSGMEPHVFVTKDGGIGFNHYGTCAVRPIGEWVKLALQSSECERRVEEAVKAERKKGSKMRPT